MIKESNLYGFETGAFITPQTRDEYIDSTYWQWTYQGEVILDFSLREAMALKALLVKEGGIGVDTTSIQGFGGV